MAAGDLMYAFLTNLSRRSKRAVLIAMDICLIPLALFVAYSLRYGMVNPSSVFVDATELLVVLVIAGAAIVHTLGIHRIKLQDFEMQAVARVGVASFLLAATAILTSYLFQTSTPRSVPLIFGVTYFVFSLSARVAGILLLALLRELQERRDRVVIYGAGTTGVQIASALRISDKLRAMAFVDDNHTLQGLQIGGLKVRAPSEIPELIKRYGIQKILLAMPAISNARREEILRSLRKYDCEVQMLPSHAELIERGRLEDNLRPVKPDELLGRGKVDLDVPEVAKAYAGRSVMVTGAGGSIGSELCRQLADCRPKKIVLFEHSEFALYKIDQELRSLLAEDSTIEIKTRLGSITNAARVQSVLAQEEIEIILHAAAYKHVPLVEDNEIEGARNNVIGTKTLADAASAAGVERLILISTDKAVRPTNIMGATKRLAELVLQDIQTRDDKTKYAMVRFGNVLGSSGSVLPLFQSQIATGGPVTVTHRNVTRFFMTIPEAARLVLLAGAYSEGGDVFVLDMGKPVKIMDIARRMIELSGQTVKEEGERNGIEIKVTGLRSGEKLYEELLIDDKSLVATPHEKILRAEEEKLSEIEMQAMLRRLKTGIETADKDVIRATVEAYVAGYHIGIDDAATLPSDRPGT